jgi:hypothetical protein
VNVVGLTQQFILVAAGENHSCAFSQNLADFRCWGDNTFGQLGSSISNPSTPVFLDLQNTRGLYAGGSHTCIVEDDGEIVCWGLNASGQIGNGNTTPTANWQRSKPTLGGPASVVATGGSHTCALMQTGQRKCWGDNSVGQYGNGLVQSETSPLDVSNLTMPVFGIASTAVRLHAGTHTVTVSYHDGNYDPASVELSQVVLPGSATLTFHSAPNPSEPGQSAMFTAALNTINASVSIQLWEGSQLLGTSSDNSNSAQFLLKLPPGTHQITAVATYEGDYVSPAPATIQHTVSRAHSKTTLKADPTAVAMGKPVTLVATVVEVNGSNGPITGSVTFKHDNASLGTVALVNGVARFNAGIWPSGAISFTASYSGSATFEPSNGSGIATVDPTIGMPAESSVDLSGLRGSLTAPSVARLSNGNFVVLTTLQASPATNSGTYFQIYRPLGLPVGPFTGVVPTLPGQTMPSIGAAGDGFVIVFAFTTAVGGPAEIWGMRIKASGALIGEPFKINTTVQGHVREQDVAGLKDGGFVVVWSGGPKNSSEIYAQRYNSTGRKVGGEFIINTTRTRTQAFPVVAALANGGFVVAWSSDAPDGNSDIYGQRYAANGAKAGTEIKITNIAGKSENAPSIAALHGGGFVVAWTGDPQATVYARRFTAAGLPNGAAFMVGQSNYGWWEPLGLTVLDDDRFLVAWGKGQVGNIYARVFGRTAASDGGEFRVNTPTAAFTQNLRPAAVALSERNVFLMWEKHPSGRPSQVLLRRLDLPAVP